MKIRIDDGFDLEKIAGSGQCFRVRAFADGAYGFITGAHAVCIRRTGEGLFEADCSPAEWDAVWRAYFDLGRGYARIGAAIPETDAFLRRAYAVGTGIRILKQDHWETLVTFILSQRKSIPAIKQSVELLAAAYGRPLTTPRGTVYTFPTAAEMRDVSLEDLRRVKAGYRDTYLLSATQLVNGGALDLDALETLPDGALFDAICTVRGVGRKVASCVCLFSYGRTALAPVDTWIRKVIDARYGGADPFPAYGENAGIMQQYLFYYSITHKDEFRGM